MSNIQLSKRLLCVASSVKNGGVVADIGCDHGFTSIYMIQNAIARRAIAMDINKGPLEGADKHIMEAGLSEYIETRLSDGAHKLEIGEADTILISGMGGALIKKILSERIEVVKSTKELVLSPQSEIFLVRHFLHDNGFKIESEQMVFDQGKYYVVIRAVPGCERYDDETEYFYGKKLIENKDETFRQFLEKEKNRVNSILGGIAPKELSEDTKKRQYELEKELGDICNIIDRFEEK